MLAEAMDYKTITEQYGRLISVSRLAPGLNLRDFLRQAHGHERFYWENAHEDAAYAGFGAAVELTAWGAERFHKIEQRTRELFEGAIIDDGGEPLARPRLFGGFAFRDDFTPDNTWSVFTPAHFILPHVQLTRIGDETWLTLNAHLAPEDLLEDVLPELHHALDERYMLLTSPPNPLSKVERGSDTPVLGNVRGGEVKITYPMAYEAWAEAITRATHIMQAGELQKVVMSRICEIRLTHSIDVDAALDYLTAHYANAYRFLFEPQPGHAFFGATPELLARVDGQQVTTMGLAGSIKRGKSPEEEQTLEDQILNDPKERYEHALVVDEIKRRFGAITNELTVPDAPSLYKLSNIQHLYTPISGHLRESMGILPLVELLHPTPALGGQPRDLAMDFIRDAEPAPRGWYAAPIGMIDSQLDGAFAVAIRSAVVQDKRAWLYAGAGIVAESQPQKEWDETALKFRPMLGALGIEKL